MLEEIEEEIEEDPVPKKMISATIVKRQVTGRMNAKKVPVVENITEDEIATVVAVPARVPAEEVEADIVGGIVHGTGIDTGEEERDLTGIPLGRDLISHFLLINPIFLDPETKTEKEEDPEISQKKDQEKVEANNTMEIRSLPRVEVEAKRILHDCILK